MSYIFRSQKDLVNDIDLFDPNKSMRMPICLCIDTSAAMGGYNYQLKEDVITLLNDIYNDEFLNNCVELGIYIFSSGVKKVRDIVTLKDTEAATLTISIDDTCDYPDLGSCLSQCIQAIERRKKDYNVKMINYYQPHIIVLGVSEPVIDDSWKNMLAKVHDKQEKERLSVIPISIGDVQLEAYKQITKEGQVYRVDIGALKDILKTVKNSMRKLSESSATIYHKLNSMVSDWGEYLK